MITVKPYSTFDGKQISTYTITNGNGIKAVFTDFGGTLLNLYITKDYKTYDVVLGFDSFEDYLSNPEYMGCVIAPNADRVAKGKCTINGISYQMEINADPDNLHTSDRYAANKQIMKADYANNSITFSIHFNDLQAGLPGNRDFSVTYTLDDTNDLSITYKMHSDKDTIFSPTNHSYFNLNGHDSGSTFKHILKLDCDCYLPCDETSIPTGEIKHVTETIFDFREGKPIGQDYDEENEQFKITKGYDHCFAINNYDKTIRQVAILEGDISHIVMKVYTDLPGILFYNGNYLNRIGKNGVHYHPHDSISLETEYFPDSINHNSFPSCVMKAHETRRYHTILHFDF